MLIAKTVPKGYENYANLFHDSIRYRYIDKHEKCFKYYLMDFSSSVTQILKDEKLSSLLIDEEKQYLNLVLKLFSKGKNKRIRFDDYLNLAKLGFDSLEKRLSQIKTILLELIKKANIKSSDLDNKYLITLENVQEQLFELRKILKNVRKLDYKHKNVLNTARRVVENYLNLIISIAEADYDSINDIYSSTFDVYGDSYMKLDLDNKIVA